MPRRSVLTVTQLETLLAFPATEPEMARYYTFDDRDLAIIRQRRGAQNRLGFAIQLCHLRYPGQAMAPEASPPDGLLGYVSQQLRVNPVLLPALRERREDIPSLVTDFVNLFSRRMGKQIDSIPPETMAAFQLYSWPGNIRELQNLVERAVILSRDGVLQNTLRKNQTEVVSPALHHTRTFYTSKILDDSDRALILETLEQTRWLVGGPHGAAAKLGLKRTTLIAIMRRLDIRRAIHQEGTYKREMAAEIIRRENAHS